MKLVTILQVDLQMMDLQSVRNLLIEKFTTEHAPYKIGERATITGYAHTGKELVVQRIMLRKDYSAYRWVIHGTLVLKDGTVGKATTSFHEKLKEDI